jgi:mycothiol synthase
MRTDISTSTFPSASGQDLDVPGSTARPLTMDDAPAMHELFMRSAAVDGDADDQPSPDEILHWYFDAPGSDPTVDSLGVFADGRLTGYGWVLARQDPERMGRTNLLGTVDPSFRRRGIGRWLLARQEERARQILRALPPELPSRMDVWARVDLEDRKALFRAAGFSPIRYFTKMARALERPVEITPLPDGLRIVRWTRELDMATRDAHNDAFVDHWGSEPVPVAKWRHRYSEDKAFLAELSFLAIEGDTVVGYVMSGAFEADHAAPGGPQAWMETIGVRRSHRKRGVASALISRGLVAFREAGFARAMLDVDTENPTGALGLYERHGFVATSRYATYGKMVNEGAGSEL